MFDGMLLQLVEPGVATHDVGLLAQGVLTVQTPGFAIEMQVAVQAEILEWERDLGAIAQPDAHSAPPVSFPKANVHHVLFPDTFPRQNI